MLAVLGLLNSYTQKNREPHKEHYFSAHSWKYGLFKLRNYLKAKFILKIASLLRTDGYYEYYPTNNFIELKKLTDLINLNVQKKILFVFLLLSLMGLPPLMGFWTKALLFYQLYLQHYYFLILILFILNTISLIYYINICKLLLFDKIKNQFVNNLKKKNKIFDLKNRKSQQNEEISDYIVYSAIINHKLFSPVKSRLTVFNYFFFENKLVILLILLIYIVPLFFYYFI